jgi:hypothetical protein
VRGGVDLVTRMGKDPLRAGCSGRRDAHDGKLAGFEARQACNGFFRLDDSGVDDSGVEDKGSASVDDTSWHQHFAGHGLCGSPLGANHWLGSPSAVGAPDNSTFFFPAAFEAALLPHSSYENAIAAQQNQQLVGQFPDLPIPEPAGQRPRCSLCNPIRADGVDLRLNSGHFSPAPRT